MNSVMAAEVGRACGDELVQPRAGCRCETLLELAAARMRRVECRASDGLDCSSSRLVKVALHAEQAKGEPRVRACGIRGERDRCGPSSIGQAPSPQLNCLAQARCRQVVGAKEPSLSATPRGSTPGRRCRVSDDQSGPSTFHPAMLDRPLLVSQWASVVCRKALLRRVLRTCCVEATRQMSRILNT